MLWSKLAGLPLVVEACEYDTPCSPTSPSGITTHVRLSGAGEAGLGEDVSVPREDASRCTRPGQRGRSWASRRWPASANQIATLESWQEPPRVALTWAWPAEAAALPGNCSTRPKGLGVRARRARLPVVCSEVQVVTSAIRPEYPNHS